MHFVSAIIGLISFLVSCQTFSAALDCDGPTDSDLAAVISYIITNSPTIDVMRFQPVCLAHSRQRGRYRYVSVVVEYTCNGSSNCPNSSPAVEQFESECVSGSWSNIAAAHSPAHARTKNPTANFSTTTRNDCTFCYSQVLISEATFALTSDSFTHCVGEFISRSISMKKDYA